MDSGMYRGFFEGIATMLIIGGIALSICIGLGLYNIYDYFFLEDKIESKKIIVPEVIIKSETINGVTKSDTTYVYKFE